MSPDRYATKVMTSHNSALFIRELAKIHPTVDADATSFICAVNIDAEVPLGNAFVVHTSVSVAEAVALCKVINNTPI